MLPAVEVAVVVLAALVVEADDALPVHRVDQPVLKVKPWVAGGTGSGRAPDYHFDDRAFGCHVPETVDQLGFWVGC